MHELASGEIFVKGKQVKSILRRTSSKRAWPHYRGPKSHRSEPQRLGKRQYRHGSHQKAAQPRSLQQEQGTRRFHGVHQKAEHQTPSGDQITGNLSGGNQQKIVIAKWLLNDPDIIILDEPTRGIDVGAKRDIYLLLGKLVQQGKAVIMISSEIPELMGVCDRIMVMCEGNLSGEVQRDAFSQERIMTLASAIEV